MSRYCIYGSIQVSCMMYVVTVLPPLAQNNPLSFNIVYNEHTSEHVINSSNNLSMFPFFCMYIYIYIYVNQ